MLAASPAWKTMKPAELQDLHDSLIMTAALMLTFHALGESDAAMKKAAVDMATAALKQLTGSTTGA